MSPYDPPTEDGPDPDQQRDEAWDRKHLSAAACRVHSVVRCTICHPAVVFVDTAPPEKKGAVAVFVDGNPAGCKCTGRCEFPCWQRVGLTEEPCCRGCVPLPETQA